MAKVERRQTSGARRKTNSERLEPDGLNSGSPGEKPSDHAWRLASGAQRLAPWAWPLLGALFLAPLKAGQVVDPLPIAAVNGLVALSLLLWA